MNPTLPEHYLIDTDSQGREKEAVRYLCDTQFLLGDLFGPLGLSNGLFWVMREVPHGKLVSSRQGDVDLLAGSLQFESLDALEQTQIELATLAPEIPEAQRGYFAAIKLASEGGIEWPPSLDYLVAVEAKCAYFDPNAGIVKSQKASPESHRDLRVQLNELLEFLPFDRVALLDVIVNPPSVGLDGQAWLSAGATAANSFHDMRATLEKRLPGESVAGQFVFSWGAVRGADERWRGSGAPRLLREAKENAFLRDDKVLQRRSQLEANLRDILAQYPKPLRFPVVLQT
jgi:hypothetical protein